MYTVLLKPQKKLSLMLILAIGTCPRWKRPSLPRHQQNSKLVKVSLAKALNFCDFHHYQR